MPATESLILGEYRRTLDARHRLSIPAELCDPLTAAGRQCLLTKERPGAVSLWSQAQWGESFRNDLALIEHKLRSGRLAGRIEEAQSLGRLLSTRSQPVEIAGRGRVLIPEGFRDFLGVEPGGELMIVGAALCVEIWRPSAWVDYVNQQMPEFRQLLEKLSG